MFRATHAQEELKLMHSLIRPKYFMPVHGEFRHLQTHAALANICWVLADGEHIPPQATETVSTCLTERAQLEKKMLLTPKE